MHKVKCFVGYGTAGIVPGISVYSTYATGHKDWGDNLPKDVGRDGYSTSLALRLYEEKKDGSIIYSLPSYDVVGGFSAGVHTCRESLRFLFTTLRNSTKDKKWTEEHMAFGFRSTVLNNEDIIRRAKIACKALNVIEGAVGIKEKNQTMLDICQKDDLFFTGEYGIKPPEDSTEHRQDRPLLREFVKKIMTYYMFRPAACWYTTSATMSLFFLVVRNALCEEIKDDFNDFDSFVKSFESTFLLGSGILQDTYSGALYDPFTGSVQYSLGSKTSDFKRLRESWPYTLPLLKNIDEIRDDKYEYSITNDQTYGITAFIADLKGGEAGRGDMVSRFRKILNKQKKEA